MATNKIKSINQRRSEVLLEKIQEPDKDDMREEVVEWQQAVVNELSLLDSRQNALEDRVDKLENDETLESPDISLSEKTPKRGEIQAHAIHEKVDALALQIGKIKTEYNDLIARVELLETENDTLRARNTDLRKDLEEVKEKLESNVSGDELQSEIQKILDKQSKDYKELERKINLRRSSGNSDAAPDATRRLKITIPKFKGLTGERPVKFLTELQNYIALMHPDDQELKCIISQALEGEAQNWWYLLQDSVNSLESFTENFKDRFWNKNIQKYNARKIEYGQFTPGTRNRVSYATYMFGLARELELNLDEHELVKKVAEHFEREIRRAVTGHKIQKINEFLEMLADFDNDDSLKKKENPITKLTPKEDTNQKITNTQNTNYSNKTDQSWVSSRDSNANTHKTYSSANTSWPKPKTTEHKIQTIQSTDTKPNTNNKTKKQGTGGAYKKTTFTKDPVDVYNFEIDSGNEK